MTATSVYIRPTWRNRAACAGAPTGDLFFPNSADGIRPGYCDNCTVTTECFDAALEDRSRPEAYWSYEWRGGRLISGHADSLVVHK